MKQKNQINNVHAGEGQGSPRGRVCWLSSKFCTACLLVLHLPAAAGLCDPHALHQGGRIPAGQLEGAVAAHNARRREALGTQYPGSQPVRGGSPFQARLAFSLHFDLWKGVSTVRAEELARAWKRLYSAICTALLFAWEILWSVLYKITWLGLGFEMYSLDGQLLVNAQGGVPTFGLSCDGPLREAARRLKSAVFVLADVEIAFYVAIKHCLMQFALLAFGRRDSEMDDLVDSDDDESDEPEHECQTQNGVKHIFLRDAVADAAIPSPAMHAHNHGIHSCQRAGCRLEMTSTEPDLGHSSPARTNGGGDAAMTDSQGDGRRCGTPAADMMSSACDSDTGVDGEGKSIGTSELRERVKVPIHLRSPGCRSASIVGSWNDWGQRYDLARMGEGEIAAGDFVGLLALPPGRYEFKFIIDGKWRTSDGWPVVADSRGILNNILEVVRPPGEDGGAVRLRGGLPGLNDGQELSKILNGREGSVEHWSESI